MGGGFPTLLLALAPFQVPVTPAPPSEPAHPWVVKDVIPPLVQGSLAQFWWNDPLAIGDPDGDGLPALLLPGRGERWTGGDVHYAWLHDGMRLDVRWTTHWIQNSTRPVFGDSFEETSAVLASPQGPRIVYEVYFAQGFEVRDLQTGAVVHAVAGQRALETRSAGDLDGDGWEDFFRVTEGAVAAAWSGATGARLWTNALGSTYFSLDVAKTAGRLADLDGDGLDDLVIALTADVPGSVATAWEIQALSGADGQPLWQAGAAGQFGFSHPRLAQGEDWTGDGVTEFVLVLGQDLMALDGASGTVLWQESLGVLDPLLVPNGIAALPEGAPQLVRRPEDPSRVDITLPITQLLNFGQLEIRGFLFHLRAEDGSLRHRDDFPVDLQPWMPDPMRDVYSGQLVALGDVDRDGLAEYGATLRVQVPFGQTGYGQAAVILGMQTLDFPERLQAGRIAIGRVHLPGAANRPWVLAVSEDVEPAGGRRLAGWRTHLKATSLLGHSLRARPASGTLDAQGQASFPMRVPVGSALIGTVVHAKVVVPDGIGGVWTTSTLASAEILP